MFGIVAINKKNIIGNKGSIPWHFSEDLKFFKERTIGGTVIVGRKTADMLPILKGRIVISLSRESGVDVRKVLQFYHTMKTPVFVIGGATVYDQFMPYINTFFVTKVNDDSDGDTKMCDSFLSYFEFSEKYCRLSSDCEVEVYVRKVF